MSEKKLLPSEIKRGMRRTDGTLRWTLGWSVMHGHAEWTQPLSFLISPALFLILVIFIHKIKVFTHIDYFVLHTSSWSKFKEGEGGRGSSWSEYLEGCVVGKRSAESLKWKTVVQPGGRRHYWAGWNPEDFVVMIIIGHNVGLLIMRRPWSQFHWVWMLLRFLSLLPQTLQ